MPQLLEEGLIAHRPSRSAASSLDAGGQRRTKNNGVHIDALSSYPSDERPVEPPGKKNHAFDDREVPGLREADGSVAYDTHDDAVLLVGGGLPRFYVSRGNRMEEAVGLHVNSSGEPTGKETRDSGLARTWRSREDEDSPAGTSHDSSYERGDGRGRYDDDVDIVLLLANR